MSKVVVGEVSSSTSSRGSSQPDRAATDPATPAAADQQVSQQKQGCWEQLQFDNINDARGYAIVSSNCVLVAVVLYAVCHPSP
jgi:hypothetical protein